MHSNNDKSETGPITVSKYLSYLDVLEDNVVWMNSAQTGITKFVRRQLVWSVQRKTLLHTDTEQNC